VAEDFTNHAKAEAACVGILGLGTYDVNWYLQVMESTRVALLHGCPVRTLCLQRITRFSLLLCASSG
jgi:hypothetical protein